VNARDSVGDEYKNRAERAREIGLFRYRLIREAADPVHSTKERGRMVRAIAAVEHTDPFGRLVRVSRKTLDRWIRDWRTGGFDALVPNPRQPTPRTPGEVMELAVALRRENRTAPPPRSGGSCAPSWGGPRMNAPCSGTSPGSV
jgi:putative transposase